MREINKPQSKGSKQLFRNPVLEKFSRTHIAIPISIFFIYSAGLLYWNVTHTQLNLITSIISFCIGLLAFTWVEYLVHRYLFHMNTHTELRSKIQYTMHGVHHDYPKDKERLAMPPILSITIATLFLFLFRLFLGDLVFSFLPGFLVGYSLYLLVHYLVHAYPPPGNFLKHLWINHSIHHYRDSNSVYGVSSPLWDYVYGTMSQTKSKAQGKKSAV